ncbi:MAG: hypothetical protein ABIQ99_16240 [Thermoflexales bacterium]
MPAYRNRVFVFPERNGDPAWIEDFPLWWDRSAFFEAYGNRRIDTGHMIYDNDALLITGAEARAWDAEWAPRFGRDPRSITAWYAETRARWNTLLKTTSWVVVESYEWESGLD